MSDTQSSSRDSPGMAAPATAPAAAATPGLAARTQATREVAALIQLAELDAALIAEDRGRRQADHDMRVHQRLGLAAKLTPEILEAYNRALRAGRRPAVVRLAVNVCSGCQVRLHSTLEQRIRRRRGVGSCPHCLRLVYDTVWLHSADPAE